MKCFCLYILFLLAFTVNGYAQGPVQTIPGFTFYKLNQTPFTNKNIEPGKKVFIVFFDPGCGHCQRAVKAIDGYYNHLKTVSILFVTLDKAPQIITFMDKYGPDLRNKPNVTLLQDLNNEFLNKFKPRKYPSMFLFATNGKLLAYEDAPENLPQIFTLINPPKLHDTNKVK